MGKRKIIQVEDRLPLGQLIPLSIQHVFAMFGASVLVPILFGIHSGIVLLMNGVGTLLFLFLTKGQAPAYLGSSFAFLAPALLFGLGGPPQYMIVGYAKGGEMLGGAGIQIAFNVSNAMAAAIGGAAIHRGQGYASPALVGVPFALIGAIALFRLYALRNRPDIKKKQ